MAGPMRMETAGETVRCPALRYHFSDMPWGALPVEYLPCPHQHFKGSAVKREQLTREDHIALLSTPRGYRWIGEANLEQPPTYTLMRPAKKRPRQERKVLVGADQRYIHEFLSEVWGMMSPEMVDRLKKVLVDEFGMSLREAEEFIVEQGDSAENPKRNECVDADIRSHWLKEFRRLLTCKITDYIVTMMCARRSKRTRMIAEEVLKHICDVTGERCSLNKPQNRVQRIQVFVADRIAAWLSGVIAESDKEICNALLGGESGDGAAARRPPPPVKKPKPKLKPKPKPKPPEKQEEVVAEEEQGGEKTAGSKSPSRPSSKPTSKPASKPVSAGGAGSPQDKSKPASGTPSKGPSKPTSKPTSRGASKPTSKPPSKPPSAKSSTPVSKPASVEESKAEVEEVEPEEHEEVPEEIEEEVADAEEGKGDGKEVDEAGAGDTGEGEEEVPESETEEVSGADITGEEEGDEEGIIEEVTSGGEEGGPRDPLEVVKEWIGDTPKEETERQAVVTDIIEDKIREEMGELTPEEDKAVIDVSGKAGTWVDKLVKDAEKQLGGAGMGEVVPPTDALKGKLTFHVKKGESGCYYDIKRVNSKTACEKTSAARARRVPVATANICQRPSDAKPIKTPQELKEWAKWANNVVNVAEKWVSWIDKTCGEAEQKVKARQQGDPVWEKDWKKFTADAKMHSVEWRRNKKYLRESAKRWENKISASC